LFFFPFLSSLGRTKRKTLKAGGKKDDAGDDEDM
jgi:hypothetical protein